MRKAYPGIGADSVDNGAIGRGRLIGKGPWSIAGEGERERELILSRKDRPQKTTRNLDLITN
jgi:hypothetical protein